MLVSAYDLEELYARGIAIPLRTCQDESEVHHALSDSILQVEVVLLELAGGSGGA